MTNSLDKEMGINYCPIWLISTMTVEARWKREYLHPNRSRYRFTKQSKPNAKMLAHDSSDIERKEWILGKGKSVCQNSK